MALKKRAWRTVWWCGGGVGCWRTVKLLFTTTDEIGTSSLLRFGHYSCLDDNDRMLWSSVWGLGLGYLHTHRLYL
ncbi:hypothetical protein BC629DRAFT_1455433 [Irpex lacteus]|nr:hypothetical protein BC629DRAFT_1455433 [Irpex lacteus]